MSQPETPERIAIHWVHCLNSLIAKVRLVALFRIFLLLPRIVPPSGYEAQSWAIVYPSAKLPSQSNQTKSELILKMSPPSYLPWTLSSPMAPLAELKSETVLHPIPVVCISTLRCGPVTHSATHSLSPGSEPRPQAQELRCQMSKVNVFLGEEACHWVSLSNTGQSSEAVPFLSSFVAGIAY